MLLGLQRTGEQLQINPHIPKDWPEFQITYRFGETRYHIRVTQHADGKHKKAQVTMDGKVLSDGMIPLSDDGQTHEVLINLIT